MSSESTEGDAIVHLTVDDVLNLYAAIISGTTDQAAEHLRSREALEGALSRPGNYARYLRADIALQAAALAHGIAETQPFLDGNKRTALASMLTLLAVNGYELSAEVTPRQRAELMISFSHGATPAAVADMIRPYLRGTG